LFLKAFVLFCREKPLLIRYLLPLLPPEEELPEELPPELPPELWLAPPDELLLRLGAL